MVKVKKLPPAPQTAFFQENQFDPELGDGTDPIQYMRGQAIGTKRSAPVKTSRGVLEKTKKTKFMKKAQEVLKGHPNADRIMKLLQRGKDE